MHRVDDHVSAAKKHDRDTNKQKQWHLSLLGLKQATPDNAHRKSLLPYSHECDLALRK